MASSSSSPGSSTNTVNTASTVPSPGNSLKRSASPISQVNGEETLVLHDRAATLDRTLQRIQTLDASQLRAILGELVTCDKFVLKTVSGILDAAAEEEDLSHTKGKGRASVKRRMFRCLWCSETYPEGSKDMCPDRYHPAKLRPNEYRHDFWKDFNPDTDGDPMAKEQVEAIPEAYIYVCCGGDAKAPGCAETTHKSDL